MSGARVKVRTHIYLYMPNHPRAYKSKLIPEHVYIAEKVLGKALPEKAEVHHSNKDGCDNRNQNLVICEDHAYHMLLHVRQRVVGMGGDPNNDLCCSSCGIKSKECFNISTRVGHQKYCRSCQVTYNKNWYLRKKGKENDRRKKDSVC